MRQPQLGRKILELRKAKGLTQEELVEMCNLNVRTIQRIEAGEVTPRPYTIKVIFEVLGFDDKEEPCLQPGDILEKLRRTAAVPKVKVDPKLRKSLTFSLFAGICYYLLVFVETGMDISWINERLNAISVPSLFWMYELSPVLPFWYILVKLSVLVGLALFLKGFYLLGSKWDNRWLSAASMFYIIITGLIILIDIWMFLGLNWPTEFVLVSQSILYGLGLLLFSLSLLTIQREVGPSALVVGAMGVVNGVLFATVVFALFGLLMLALVELLQLLLLFKIRILLGGEIQNTGLTPEISPFRAS